MQFRNSDEKQTKQRQVIDERVAFNASSNAILIGTNPYRIVLKFIRRRQNSIIFKLKMKSNVKSAHSVVCVCCVLNLLYTTAADAATSYLHRL